MSPIKVKILLVVFFIFGIASLLYSLFNFYELFAINTDGIETTGKITDSTLNVSCGPKTGAHDCMWITISYLDDQNKKHLLTDRLGFQEDMSTPGQNVIIIYARQNPSVAIIKGLSNQLWVLAIGCLSIAVLFLSMPLRPYYKKCYRTIKRKFFKKKKLRTSK